MRKAIEDVGYVYNRGAANLRKAHSNVIGMVINDLTNPFFAELAVGMERVFQSAGIVPFIANTAENPVRQEEVLKSLMEQGVAGLIVVAGARHRRRTPSAACETAGMPVVFAMRRLPESRIPAVAPDNHRGAVARHRPSDPQGPSPAGLLRRLLRPGRLSRAARRFPRGLRDATASRRATC